MNLNVSSDTNNILFNSIVGTEIEFYSNFNIDETKDSLVSLLNKKILVFKKAHSEFVPTGDTFKLEPDFSGGEKLIELVTGPLPYQETRLIIIKVLNWIKENGYTSDRCSIHLNISFNKNLSSTFISHMNILKFILDFDEDQIYKDFSNRKDTVYAKSIKYVVPANKFYFDDISNIIPTNFTFPNTKYYGINFSKLIKSYLEFRYLGGKDYEKKDDLILKYLDYFVLSIYKSVSNRFYTDENKAELKVILNKHKHLINAYKTYSDFCKEFPEVKLSVDLSLNSEYVSVFYFNFRDKIYDIMSDTNLRKGYINYDSSNGRLQIKDSEITLSYDLRGIDIINSTICGNIRDCDLFGCTINDSDIYESNFFNNCKIVGSKLKNSYVNKTSTLDKCYIYGKQGVMNGKMNGGIFREGKVTNVSNISKDTEVIEFEKIK